MIRIVFEKDKLRAAAYDCPEEEPAAPECCTSEGAADRCKLIGECDCEAAQSGAANEAGSAVWTITHTEVDPAYGGQGIAGRLVAAVVEAARAEDMKIVPVCSYAVRQFEKHAEYRDVLA